MEKTQKGLKNKIYTVHKQKKKRNRMVANLNVFKFCTNNNRLYTFNKIMYSKDRVRNHLPKFIEAENIKSF